MVTPVSAVAVMVTAGTDRSGRVRDPARDHPLVLLRVWRPDRQAEQPEARSRGASESHLAHHGLECRFRRDRLERRILVDLSEFHRVVLECALHGSQCRRFFAQRVVNQAMPNHDDVLVLPVGLELLQHLSSVLRTSGRSIGVAQIGLDP